MKSLLLPLTFTVAALVGCGGLPPESEVHQNPVEDITEQDQALKSWFDKIVDPDCRVAREVTCALESSESAFAVAVDYPNLAICKLTLSPGSPASPEQLESVARALKVTFDERLALAATVAGGNIEIPLRGPGTYVSVVDIETRTGESISSLLDRELRDSSRPERAPVLLTAEVCPQ